MDRTQTQHWLDPRHDLVIEQPPTLDGTSHRFELADGPFSHWQRVVRVEPSSNSVDFVDVYEEIRFRLAVPVGRALFLMPLRRELRRPPDPQRRTPWWAPPDVLSPRAATVLSLLCVFGLVAGYLGTLITQTLTYAAEEFGASTGDQGTLLAGVRVGVLLSMLIVATADRRGRRSVLAVALLAACAITSLGAFAPGMIWLGATQTFARAFATVIGLLVAIIAVEEMPAGARAFAVSVLTMTAGLGAGLCVINLVYVDLAVWAWRIAYLVPLLFMIPSWRLLRQLPETFRFTKRLEADRAAELAARESERTSQSRPGTTEPDQRLNRHIDRHIDRRRFALLAASGFLWALFLAPAAQFLNEFLRTERGFSGIGIAVFVLATNTPGVIGIVLGGRLADRRGRRLVGAIGIAGGVTFTVVSYLSWGWPLWAASVVASVIGAIAIPALAVYGPELFPTNQRARANGRLQVVGVAGSSIGLLSAGWLADRLGGLGPAIAALAIGPAILIVIVLTLYPETANRHLEELNPADVNVTDPSGFSGPQ
ncbi:MAG: MFS transporter [Actinobacteria bacterium]|nr:MFS transporter [Actinomycetota bacterium]MTA77799.1 MFS transporter [Actinomycetota bacterium]